MTAVGDIVNSYLLVPVVIQLHSCGYNTITRDRKLTRYGWALSQHTRKQNGVSNSLLVDICGSNDGVGFCSIEVVIM